ncbi:MAG: hypothetical protein IPP06_02540 [Saprospiraceae bacterium]|nr:hypothetical protein [Candidatus Vicinibacter affinis]MBP6172434.1 hypothetical protein [Saprospiraceae bacterium]MBK6573385.1 hypothetical protein [Candidatus Vicinibacter affinis]MBK7302064.1 hypothetical protein [Candidatus Vicinibacter affinis]MBK7693206.1 hypothetical protein [Candidatus Vicinibacter affinis]
MPIYKILIFVFYLNVVFVLDFSFAQISGPGYLHAAGGGVVFLSPSLCPNNSEEFTIACDMTERSFVSRQFNQNSIFKDGNHDPERSVFKWPTPFWSDDLIQIF